MGTEPNGTLVLIPVSVQFKHVHTILYKPFESVWVLVSGSVDTSLRGKAKNPTFIKHMKYFMTLFL